MIDQNKLALTHIVKKELQLSNEEYRHILFQVAGVHSAKELDEKKFSQLMNYFIRRHYYRFHCRGMTFKQRFFIKSLAKQLEWTEEHLENFIRKYYHQDGLTQLSRKDASKIIEGLKHIRQHQSMNKEFAHS